MLEEKYEEFEAELDTHYQDVYETFEDEISYSAYLEDYVQYAIDLDVYKRQTQQPLHSSPKGIPDGRVPSPSYITGYLRVGLAPVSYTHLDVYKRQDIYLVP